MLRNWAPDSGVVISEDVARVALLAPADAHEEREELVEYLLTVVYIQALVGLVPDVDEVPDAACHRPDRRVAQEHARPDGVVGGPLQRLGGCLALLCGDLCGVPALLGREREVPGLIARLGRRVLRYLGDAKQGDGSVLAARDRLVVLVRIGEVPTSFPAVPDEQTLALQLAPPRSVLRLAELIHLAPECLEAAVNVFAVEPVELLEPVSYNGESIGRQRDALRAEAPGEQGEEHH